MMELGVSTILFPRLSRDNTNTVPGSGYEPVAPKSGSPGSYSDLDLNLLSTRPPTHRPWTRSVMPDPFLVGTDGGEDVILALRLQLPTALLVEIVVVLNQDYLKGLPRTTDPLPALRL